MERPTKFEIIRLFGNRDIRLDVDSNALILVGPNGIGKSSVTNIFYFFVTRQWARLAEYTFSEVAIWFGDEEVRASRSDITALSQIDKLYDVLPPSSKTSNLISRLRTDGFLEEFFSRDRLSIEARGKIASALDLPRSEVSHLHFSIRRQLANFSDSDLFAAPQVDIEKRLVEKLPGRSLYLPTYRRIEKDLKEIFPDLEDRLRSSARLNFSTGFAHSSKHYIDLVSFGMEDVRSNIEEKSRFLRDYSLAQFNDLSGLYLRDVIKGTADQYPQGQIATLGQAELSTILNRVSEQVLSADDKKLLNDKILDIKSKKKNNLDVNDRYLAHYFSRLMSASADISQQENDILSFVEVCNEYLDPSKPLIYDDTKFTVEIIDQRGNKIDLSMLSSGEKQVVSLFSHLYLDNSSNQMVIIDEPELSLSVPWQKRFLPDILDSGRCSFVLAVTHSPFIYQNRLSEFAVDLRRRTILVD